MRGRHSFDAALSFRWRAYVLVGLLICAATGLVWRAANLQLVDHTFLEKEGDARFSRVVQIAAHRGTITDRYGEPLAVSTPVDSIWVNPKEIALASDQIPRLASALKQDRTDLARRITSNLDRDYLYLARHREPSEAERIKARGIPGVYLSREYRRYSQTGEGSRPVRPGRDLVLSIDLRVQYLAYRELKAAIRDNRATGGSVVVLDITTGEVLAMVNQPAYNPNDREHMVPGAYRNRAVTDIFEPGSSMKPFFVATGIAA